VANFTVVYDACVLYPGSIRDLVESALLLNEEKEKERRDGYTYRLAAKGGEAMVVLALFDDEETAVESITPLEVAELKIRPSGMVT
jgi:hypothetical protein